ncbi:purine NTPase [Thermoproteus sp. CP80]|uniref:AAA family ATPase n=1 Tax=Thermoproteus sp. CP80 TaxID=1650659 RepID=UPI0009BE9C27|nr:SMC family ATPase [Thermoproteus sp. CP80]PLC67229.1 purine NTPase [Thermoproteus sp. CP80]
MLRSIELRNFKAHEELAADFVEGVNFIYGPNGAGKSSLLEAIAVALYGSKWIQKVKARWADLVRRGAAEASIQLAFVGIDGVEYVVARRFGQSGSISSGTYLLADGKPAARGDQDVTAAVAKALGLGVEEFANLAYIRQGELRRILAEPDYIDRLFRLDEFDWLDEVLRDVLSDVSRRRERASGRLEELGRRAEDLSKRAVELEAQSAEARREAEGLAQYFQLYKKAEEELGGLRERAAALEQEAKSLNSLVERLEEELVELDVELDRKSEELKELERLEGELASLPRPDPAVEAKYYEAKRVVDLLAAADLKRARSFRPEELEAARREVEELKARRADVLAKLGLAREVLKVAGRASGGRCPVCGGSLTEETVRRHEEEAKALEEELRRVEARIYEAESAVRRLERDREEYLKVKDYLSVDLAEARRRLEELKRLYEAQRDLERRRAEISARLAARDRIERELRGLEARRAEVERRLGEARRRLEEVEGQLSALRPRLAELGKSYEELRAKAEAYLKAASRAEELARQLGSVKAELERVSKELEAARAEAERHGRAEERGKAARSALRDVKPVARRILIESVNAELNGVFLKLRHNESLRSAELAQIDDRYYVVVSRSDGQRFRHTELSLGEANLAALALRVALARALLGRPPFLILDEPTEHLDETHRRRIVELVRDLAIDVKTVLVTSHLGEFEEVADRRIDL